MRYLITGFLTSLAIIAQSQIIFFDDFESNLDKWVVPDSNMAQIIYTKDALHKSVLKLNPNNTAECVLIKNSGKWNGIAIEDEVLFPSDQHNYLGLVYNYQDTERKDFGCIYIKGNDGYVRVNPHRDGNASRSLYEEYKTNLTGNNRIKINEWIPFKAEIIGSECHFYVKDFTYPVVIFKFYEYPSGMTGFKPRFAGAECWIDNIKVSTVNDFDYDGEYTTDTINYSRDSFINEWSVIGPFSQKVDKIEKSQFNNPIKFEGENYIWSTFKTDGRGCVVAGRICRFSNDQKFAYFSTSIEENEDTTRTLEFGY